MLEQLQTRKYDTKGNSGDAKESQDCEIEKGVYAVWP